jgi:CO/xanthine dehydrogenase FAD-binding subunit
MAGIEIDLATSVEHALELLAPADPLVRPVAGATDVVLRLHVGKLKAQRLISIADLPELSYIKAEPEGFRFGAGTPLSDLLANAAFRSEYPSATEALRQFASPQIRNRATVGGNIVNASPAADMVPPLISYGAWVRMKSKKDGERALPVEEVFQGFGKTAIRPDELVTEVFVPRRKRCFQAYAKFGSRSANVIAVINMAMCLKLDGDTIAEARVAYGSVAPKPYRALRVEDALTGRQLGPDLARELEAVIRSDIQPIDDVRGSQRYKLRLAINATQDALTRARAEVQA